MKGTISKPITRKQYKPIKIESNKMNNKETETEKLRELILETYWDSLPENVQDAIRDLLD